MLGKTKNPQLQQVEQAVEDKVPPDLQDALQRIVTGGLTVMYSPQTRQMLVSQLNKPGEPTEVAGEGIAKLMALLYKQSKGTMPMKAAVPAAQILLCEGLDFMAEAGKVQITSDTIAQATKAMMAYLLQVFGFSKDKVQQFMQAGAQNAAPQQAAPAGIIAQARGA